MDLLRAQRNIARWQGWKVWVHAAFAADVNTLVPASEAATGLDSGDRSALGGFMELSQAELGQLLESIMWQRAVSHRDPRWPLAGNA